MTLYYNLENFISYGLTICVSHSYRNSKKFNQKTDARKEKRDMAKKKIVIKEFPKEVLDITIQGNSDVILNKMTDEAIEEIKDTQTKNAKGSKKAPLNMWQRLIGGLHWMDNFSGHPYLDVFTEDMILQGKTVGASCIEVDGKKELVRPQYTEESYNALLQNNRIGYDASGIKKGLLEAAVRVLGESKSTVHNANIQIIPEKKNLIPISFGESDIDESVITNWKGNAFLTYRTVLRDWKMKIRVEYLPANISMDQVVELFQAMGFSGGIGAHRIGLKGGTNGSFKVVNVEQVA